jgi:CubicO group peptidase (beta-lactamase class C family)
MESVNLAQHWPVQHAAVAVVSRQGEMLGTYGDSARPFQLASVTKLLTAYATLIAVEEGAVNLDDAAGPAGCTVRHLLAHTSGLAFNKHKAVFAPGKRRLYSNAGFEELADEVAKRSGIPFADYVRDGLLMPLRMTRTIFEGSPSSGATSTLTDLTRFAAELHQPTLLDPQTLATATTVAFPGLDGVLPGYGYHKPNDWGLGFEIRAMKAPHWTGPSNSPRTFGHFGQTGTFLWVDPVIDAACVGLTDRNFGLWAVKAWPVLADAIVHELRPG